MNQANQQQRVKGAPLGGKHNSLRIANVLLVDDDVVVLETLSFMLSSLGIDVTTAMNADPVRQANLDHFQCIILDVWLPDSYGYEVLDILDKKAYEGAVLLISGIQKNEINDIAKMGLQQGLAVIGYLKKPFDKNDIEQMLARASRL